MKSTIYLDEKVPNLDRRFGSAKEYYPVTIISGDNAHRGLFTPAAIKEAIRRGRANPEDFPTRDCQDFRPWWKRLIDWLKADD